MEVCLDQQKNLSKILTIFFDNVVCGLPMEYCEYGPSFTKCKTWIKQNHPKVFTELFEEESN